MLSAHYHVQLFFFSNGQYREFHRGNLRQLHFLALFGNEKPDRYHGVVAGLPFYENMILVPSFLSSLNILRSQIGGPSWEQQLH